MNPNAASGPAAVDRLDRDVLGISGLTDVIWLDDINDVRANHPTGEVIADYMDVVARLRACGIKVYGGTLTSALGISGVDQSDNGPGHDVTRRALNDFIPHLGPVRRCGGHRRGDARPGHPAAGNMAEEFVPNRRMASN